MEKKNWSRVQKNSDFLFENGFDTVKINFSLEDENVIFFNSCVWIKVLNFNFVKEEIFCEEKKKTFQLTIIYAGYI